MASGVNCSHKMFVQRTGGSVGDAADVYMDECTSI